MSDSAMPLHDPPQDHSSAPICPPCKTAMPLARVEPHSDPARTAKQFFYECSACGYRYTMTIEQA
jgi:hypothetical protein